MFTQAVWSSELWETLTFSGACTPSVSLARWYDVFAPTFQSPIRPFRVAFSPFRSEWSNGHLCAVANHRMDREEKSKIVSRLLLQ